MLYIRAVLGIYIVCANIVIINILIQYRILSSIWHFSITQPGEHTLGDYGFYLACKPGSMGDKTIKSSLTLDACLLSSLNENFTGMMSPMLTAHVTEVRVPAFEYLIRDFYVEHKKQF